MNDERFIRGLMVTDGITQIVGSTAGSAFLASIKRSWVTANVRQVGEVVDRV
jgi:hypothetical protein